MNRPSNKYFALAATTVVATLILIAIGSIVRTTGSGLGCPDWPLCHGQLHPPLEKTAIIEYSHRTAAAVVGVLVVATAVVTLRTRWTDLTSRWLAIASLPLLGFQAWLGKETVERELPPEVVTFHLATAMILLAILTMLAGFAFLGTDRTLLTDGARGRALRVAAIGAAVTFVVLLSGAYVVGANASNACTSWPGCSEATVPFADGAREQSIHWLHRFVVAGGLAAVVSVAWALLKLEGAGMLLRRAAWLLVALYAGQILVGASNMWTDFSEASRVAHLALGSAIWALMVLIAVAGRYRAGARGGARMESQPSRSEAAASV
ncbi:MAG: COX15/CtaA family protein [Dehalococcoidia bacterium]|nr:COX15/CtaA family protein [Dehalococcoidia bacterium]